MVAGEVSCAEPDKSDRAPRSSSLHPAYGHGAARRVDSVRQIRIAQDTLSQVADVQVNIGVYLCVCLLKCESSGESWLLIHTSLKEQSLVNPEYTER